MKTLHLGVQVLGLTSNYIRHPNLVGATVPPNAKHGNQHSNLTRDHGS